MKSYYVLSKSLNGFDLNNEDEGWTEYDESIESEEYIDESTEEDEEYQKRLNTLLECIEEVGRAYLDNVYTYQGADKQAYNGEDAIENKLSKSNSNEYDVIDPIFNEKKKLLRSTTNAYKKWNERKGEVYEKIYEQVKNNVVASDDDLTDEKEQLIVNLSKQKMKTLLTQMKTVKNNNITLNPTAIHHLDLFDVYDGFGNDFTIYNFDNTIELGRANTKTFVGDDCSCFAAAVYLYYLNKVDGKNKEKVDLWTTGSGDFIKKSNNNPDNILNILTDVKNGFAVYQWDADSNTKVNDIYNIYKISDFELKPGDLLYRKKQDGKSAHVEFYLGEEKSFGWGEIQTSFDDNRNAKQFEIIRNLDIYNIGKTKIANQVSSGEKYRIEGNAGAGIYNTVKAYDANCRYDYVIRLENSLNNMEDSDE